MNFSPDKSYLHSVIDLRTTFTQLSNLVPRQVASGRGSFALSFLVYNNQNYDNSN